jgi:hypothetical protein
VPPGAGERKQDPAGEIDEDEDDHRRRNASEAIAHEILQGRVDDRLDVPAHQDESDGLDNQAHRNGRDDRVDPDLHHKHRVRQADDAADGQATEDRQEGRGTGAD